MSFDIPFGDQMRIALSYVKFKTNQRRMRTNEKVVTDTIYGKVKGVKWHSVYGGSYYSFEGIPFAKPPIGRLRFRAPEEPEPWTDVRRCTREHLKPCQYNIILKQVQGREDCLYLNVFTKTLHPQKPMPVLVWIYGGGFQMGEASRDMYSPDYFMMENVVVITITYRLGPLGFLVLEDPELDVPGNAGLKDQVMALRWVKRNCQFFGGDPDNITVFGESAGAASTHYMMLTEQARDLFHKCVLMSGTALAPWANIPQYNWAYRLAKATGYRGENEDRQVFEHLQHCKASSLVKVCEDLLTSDERHQRMMFSFGPTVEPYVSKHCVIPRPPLEMMRSAWGNEIPLLIGGNSSEGLLMFTEARKYPELMHKLSKDATYLVPDDANVNMAQRKDYGEKLLRLHFGDNEPRWETVLQYADIFSYKYFWHGIHRTLLSRLHHANSPTYLYRFDFDSKHFNFMRIITCGRNVRGTCHADDLSYLFYNAGAKKLKQRSAEFRTIRRLTTMLVRFAECGNPNIPMNEGHDHSYHYHHHHRQPAHHMQPVQASNQNGSSNALQNVQHKANGDGHEHHSREHSTDGSFDDSVSDGIEPALEVKAALTKNETPPQETWLPVSRDSHIFKCLNISDELEVIDLPEAEKLRLWDEMYTDKALLY
ncbi:PREDICTED: esterase B1-like [Bactrocera latifrons]|uniref:Carboxylic ester hydrolase n=1 Tax=Bactrocera latifrons TaxID=174628 RepID=A0A0K8UIN9_BACLA|nr:PREDICTED: esterase B1-like [Bactrocera latifrons]XP_018796328.1 PREDICTED: esterase B1-like [Bactrocera latifrons]